MLGGVPDLGGACHQFGLPPRSSFLFDFDLPCLQSHVDLRQNLLYSQIPLLSAGLSLPE